MTVAIALEGLAEIRPPQLTLLPGGEADATISHMLPLVEDGPVQTANIPHYQAAAAVGQEFAKRPQYGPSAERLSSLLRQHGAVIDGNPDLQLHVKHVVADWESPRPVNPAEPETMSERFGHLHGLLAVIDAGLRPAFIIDLQHERVAVMNRDEPPVRGDFTLNVLSYVAHGRRFDASAAHNVEAALPVLDITRLQSLRAAHPSLKW